MARRKSAQLAGSCAGGGRRRQLLGRLRFDKFAGLRGAGGKHALPRQRPPRAFERIELDVLDRPLLARPAIDRALDDVAQFAHVARPFVGPDPLHRARAEAWPGHVDLHRHASAEMLGEDRNIALAVAQRRQGDDLEAQPVEQVGAEAAFLDQPRQMLVGGSDDPDVDLERPARSDPRHLAIFDRAQQPILGRARQGGELVEEQGAAIGLLETPRAGPWWRR